MVRNKKIAQRFLMILLSGIPAQETFAVDCKAPCVPFNVSNADVGGIVILQPEFTDCITKQIQRPHLQQAYHSNYCVLHGTNIRIEQWTGSGTNSWNVWGPYPVDEGWTLDCKEGDHYRMHCVATPLKKTNCKKFTVKNNTSSNYIQPEYTECVTNTRKQGQIAKEEESTYSVAENTEVRIENPSWLSTINIWPSHNIGTGWTVECKESSLSDLKCTETPVK